MVVVLTNLQSPAHLGFEAGDAAVGREARVHTRDRLLACMLVVSFVVLHGNLMSWEILSGGVLQATACTASPPKATGIPTSTPPKVATTLTPPKVTIPAVVTTERYCRPGKHHVLDAGSDWFALGKTIEELAVGRPGTLKCIGGATAVTMLGVEVSWWWGDIGSAVCCRWDPIVGCTFKGNMCVRRRECGN